MVKTRWLSVIIAMTLLTLVSPAAAMTARDPAGDVTGPLDIAKVSLVWDDTTVTGKIVMASAFDPTLLEFARGGSVQANISTLRSNGSYLYRHWISFNKYDAGALWGWMTRWRADEGDPEYGGPVKLSMPDDRTLKFVVKRKVIAGDRADSKFGFWFYTGYSNAGAGCPNYSCEDFAPDGDAIFVRRW
jgi:hypothetical protein